MKRTLFLLPLVLLVLFSCKQQAKHDNAINPVIGDISYTEKFGASPADAVDETQRIATHLQYVEQLLRKKDVSHLSPELRTKRQHLLDLLYDYSVAGAFPKNYDHPGKRKPCFIDEDGTICAVGYLVEQTAGRKAAEEINSRHKYDELLVMNDQTVNTWVAESGLTLEECAMIQPTYGYERTSSISKEYGVSSAVLGGVNLSFNALNSVQMIRGGSRSKAVPIIGIVSGLGQIVLGANNFPKPETGWNGTYTNEGQKVLSMVNIGLGTTTVILSTWNLLTNRVPKQRSVSWNVYSFPTPDKNMGVGFNLVKRF